MHLLSDFVEQLEVATRLLEERRPLKTRLAFMLIDNVAELTILHAADTVCGAGLRTWTETPRMSANMFEKVRTGGFQDRTQALVFSGIIDGKAKRVLDGCHGVRGKAHHRGDSFERVLPDLSIFYFVSICDLLSKANAGRQAHFDGTDEGGKAFLLRGGLTLATRSETTAAWSAPVPDIAEAMKKLCPTPSSPLSRVLSEDLHYQATELQQHLVFIGEEHNWRNDEGFEAVQLVQGHWLRAICRNAPRWHEFEDQASYLAAWRAYEKEARRYLPSKHVFRTDPTAIWLKKAPTLAGMESSAALNAYLDIQNRLGPLLEASIELGRGIEEAADIAANDI